MPDIRVWVGFDPTQEHAFTTARHSIRASSQGQIDAQPVQLDRLRAAGLYWRPTETREGRLWDTISEAPMSTEFAISRFLCPLLDEGDWALFMDCDVLVRTDLTALFATLDSRYAVMCVKHVHVPQGERKMDGQVQMAYARKNWSSVMAFNRRHPANAALTVDLINTLPGRDLHRFCWLADKEIGAFAQGWNWLVGHSPPVERVHIVHFTDGGPWLDDFRDVPFADEWRVAAEAAQAESS